MSTNESNFTVEMGRALGKAHLCVADTKTRKAKVLTYPTPIPNKSYR
jgi:hypothetical protein